MKTLLLLIILASLALWSFSQDTFSICAVDTVTGEVGSAGASCIDETQIPGGCSILSDVHPGVGVIHTQAYWNAANQNYASSLMDLGLPPQQIIDSLIAHDAQNNPNVRQYGVVDLSEGHARRAAFTGINCMNYKNHIIGPNYTIQGNILLGQQILDSMEVRFLNTPGELACRLMAALQGAKVIGADTRCLDDGVSSLSSFLRVAKPGDPPGSLYVDLIVPSVIPGIDPIDSLQSLVNDWGGCDLSYLEEKTNSAVLRVYPNPAKGSINISKSDNTPGILYVFDGTGLVIGQYLWDESAPHVYKTSGLHEGIYQVVFIGEDGKICNQKIVSLGAER